MRISFFFVEERFIRIVSTFLGFVCCSMCTHLVFWFNKINGYSFKATPFFSLSESLPNGKNQKRTRNCHDSNYKNNNEKKNLLKYPNIHYLKTAMPEEQSISTNMQRPIQWQLVVVVLVSLLLLLPTTT